MEFPFKEKIDKNKIIRTFSIDVDSDELIWHRDLKDRNVKVVKSGNWKFQTENNLPTLLQEDQEIFIKKGDWHRILKGDSDLVIEIVEID